jgi:predicted site-specific integrase-resolvase
MYLSARVGNAGVSEYAACQWYHAGTRPGPACRAGGLIGVGRHDRAGDGRVVVWARVLSAGQGAGLGGQVAGVSSWVTANGLAMGGAVAEPGPAVNVRRYELGRVLGDLDDTGIAGQRDRLVRFAAEHLRAALAARGSADS